MTDPKKLAERDEARGDATVARLIREREALPDHDKAREMLACCVDEDADIDDMCRNCLLDMLDSEKSSSGWNRERADRAETERDEARAEGERLRGALDDAATSLDTLSRSHFRDSSIKCWEDVRGYANSRGMVARAALTPAKEVATVHRYQCAACGGRISLQQDSPPAHGVGPCPFCREEGWDTAAAYGCSDPDDCDPDDCGQCGRSHPSQGQAMKPDHDKARRDAQRWAEDNGLILVGNLARAYLALEADRVAAAGELLVNINDCAPGTVAGQLMVANRTMRHQHNEARAELERWERRREAWLETIRDRDEDLEQLRRLRGALEEIEENAIALGHALGPVKMTYHIEEAAGYANEITDTARAALTPAAADSDD